MSEIEKKASAGTKQIPQRVCLNCGKVYIPKTVTQKYCSRTCGVAYRGSWGSYYPPTSFSCAYCGKFVATMGGRDHRTRFCCATCEKMFWKRGKPKSTRKKKSKAEKVATPDLIPDSIEN